MTVARPAIRTVRMRSLDPIEEWLSTAAAAATDYSGKLASFIASLQLARHVVCQTDADS